MPIYVGTQKIKVSGIEKVYIGTQLVYQNAAAVLDSITLSGQTTSLDKNSPFSFGGTVTAYYTNGTTADVTADTTFSGYNMSVAGTYTVTASYTEGNITKTATYTLTVNKIWESLWSGSKTIKWGGSSSTEPSVVDVAYITGLTNPSDIRVTFSATGQVVSSNTKVYYVTFNGNRTTTKPDSPVRKSDFNPTANMYNIIAVLNSQSTTGNAYFGVRLNYFTSNGRFYLGTVGSNSSFISGRYNQLTITNIEIYR